MRIGLCQILFVVFLCLKLAGVIAWSWWLVCLPLIIGFIISFLYHFVIELTKQNNSDSWWD